MVILILMKQKLKSSWEGDWPEHWAEIRIPERKQRFVDKYKGKTEC